MNHRFWYRRLYFAASFAVIFIIVLDGFVHWAVAQGPGQDFTANDIQGPVTGAPVVPLEYNGDLRRLPQISTAGTEIKSNEEEYAPGMEPKGLSRTISAWEDPVAQVKAGDGQ
ncbi:MAG: hypothetical protein ACM3PY_04340, partial [Omnitrophica WOR_2 bacterium]